MISSKQQLLFLIILWGKLTPAKVKNSSLLLGSKFFSFIFLSTHGSHIKGNIYVTTYVDIHAIIYASPKVYLTEQIPGTASNVALKEWATAVANNVAHCYLVGLSHCFSFETGNSNPHSRKYFIPQLIFKTCHVLAASVCVLQITVCADVSAESRMLLNRVTIRLFYHIWCSFKLKIT